MKKKHNSLIEHSIRFIETKNPLWARPALTHLEETQSRASINYTTLYVKRELLSSNNEAKNQWKEYLEQLEEILQQEDCDAREISKLSRVVWFHRLNYSNWSKIISNLFSAEAAFKIQHPISYFNCQADVWDFINEEEYGGEKKEKLSAIESISAHADSLLSK